MITFTADLLNIVLPPGFVADIEDRVYLISDDEPGERPVNPDVFVIKRPLLRAAPVGRGGGTAVAEREAVAAEAAVEDDEYDEDAPEIAHGIPDGLLERFIVIHAPAPERKVVTHIELLSPTNKSLSGAGYQKYRRKQRETLDSGINLLEMDLLRMGLHTVKIDSSVVESFGAWDYLICLTRAARSSANSGATRCEADCPASAFL